MKLYSYSTDGEEFKSYIGDTSRRGTIFDAIALETLRDGDRITLRELDSETDEVYDEEIDIDVDMMDAFRKHGW